MTEEQAWLFLNLGVISALATAGIAIWSIRNVRYAAVWRATLDFMHDYNNDPRIDRGLEVVRAFRDGGVLPELSGEKREDFLFLMNRLEILAIGLERRIYDWRLICDYFVHELVLIHARAAPLIAHIRRTEKDPAAFVKFENLARRAESARKKGEKNPPPT